MDSYLVPIFTFGIITFIVGMILTPEYIKLLNHFGIGKKIRENAMIGLAENFFNLHKTKTGTPTMGGGIIIGIVFFMVFLSIIFSSLGFSEYSLLNRNETYIPLFTLLSVGILGAIDDYMNVKEIGRTKGMSSNLKTLGLIAFSLCGAWWFYYKLGWGEIDANGDFIKNLIIPFFGNLELGMFFIPFFVFIIVGTAHSVNVTDGLDGLSGGLLLFAFGIYSYIAYEQGLYLLSTLCMTIVGAILAFLWFNVKPAKIYLGDVGSLGLGATLGIIAMLTNTLYILAIVGAIFAFETISVISQLLSKKFRNGRKIFRIAPFHHHLEAIGWKEETIVFRLWLIGGVLAATSLVIYNLYKSGIG